MNGTAHCDTDIVQMADVTTAKRGPLVRFYRCLMVVPTVFLGITIGVALVVFVSNSFYQTAGMGIVGPVLTVRNYSRLLDGYYAVILWRTVWISGVVTGLSALIGYPIARLISRDRSVFATVALTVVLASGAMSLVVRALGWIGILANNGPVNRVLQVLGLINDPIAFLGGDLGVVIGLVHGFVPLFVLTLLPVLQSIDRNLELAAHGLGAGSWTTFRSVVFPLSLPGVAAACLLLFAMCMGAYTTPALLAGGRAATFPMLIQQQIMTTMNYPFGATLSVVLLIVVLLLLWLGIVAIRPLLAGASK